MARVALLQHSNTRMNLKQVSMTLISFGKST